MESENRLNLFNIALVVLVVVVLGLFGFLYYQNRGKTSIVPISENTPTSQEVPDPFEGAQPNLQAQVDITPNGFVPASIVVVKGSQITFINQDTQPHKVKYDENSSDVVDFDSEESLNKGESFSYTFEEEGTFTYNDPDNPTKFKGLVIVR